MQMLAVPVLFQPGHASGNSQKHPKRARGRERGGDGPGAQMGSEQEKNQGLNEISGSFSLGEHGQAGASSHACPFSIKLVPGLNVQLEGATANTGSENTPDFLGKTRRGGSPEGGRAGLTSGSPACSSSWPPGSSSGWDPNARLPPWWARPPAGTSAGERCGAARSPPPRSPAQLQ